MKRSAEKLQMEIVSLIAAADRCEPLLDGYLYKTQIRCGKAGCRCMDSDYRHSLWCLSYVAEGKSRTRTVPEEAVPEVRALCERYRQLRQCRKQLLTLTKKLTAEIDEHVQEQARIGWAHFEQLKAKHKT